MLGDETDDNEVIQFLDEYTVGIQPMLLGGPWSEEQRTPSPALKNHILPPASDPVSQVGSEEVSLSWVSRYKNGEKEQEVYSVTVNDRKYSICYTKPGENAESPRKQTRLNTLDMGTSYPQSKLDTLSRAEKGDSSLNLDDGEIKAKVIQCRITRITCIHACLT